MKSKEFNYKSIPIGMQNRSIDFIAQKELKPELVRDESLVDGIRYFFISGQNWIISSAHKRIMLAGKKRPDVLNDFLEYNSKTAENLNDLIGSDIRYWAGRPHLNFLNNVETLGRKMTRELLDISVNDDSLGDRGLEVFYLTLKVSREYLEKYGRSEGLAFGREAPRMDSLILLWNLYDSKRSMINTIYPAPMKFYLVGRGFSRQ